MTEESKKKKTSRKTSARYADCEEQTQEFMVKVEQHLKDTFGGIKEEWQGLLSILAEQYDVFVMCKRSIKENGLMTPNRFGGLEKNPLLKAQTDAIIQVKSIAQEFGLSPKSLKRLDVKEDNTEDFIDTLVG